MVAAHAQRLKIRLFLEGVEIPVISANVNSSPNSPNVASIQIPPLAEGTRLHPRTLVHLFFWDMYEADSPFLQSRKQAEINPDENDPTASEGVTDLRNVLVHDEQSRRYKLLFVGEVVGFQWTKNTNQRALVLQCLDLSSYWDHAYQWGNSGLFGPGIKAMFSGGSTNIFTDFLSTKGSAITGIVTSGRCNTFPKLKGMAAGIVRLIEAIGGTYTPVPGSGDKKYAGQNVFFSLAELRLHITQMVAAYADDPTSKRMMQRQGYSGMFERALGGQGGQTSIRTAMNAMTAVIFHEMYGQPCPKFVPGKDGEVSGTRRSQMAGHAQWGFVVDDANRYHEGLSAARDSLLTASKENASKTRREFKRTLQLIRKSMRQTLTNITRKSRGDSKAPAAAKALLGTASSATGFALYRIAYWKPNGVAKTNDLVLDKLNEALNTLDRAKQLTVLETAPSEIEPARLMQQIFRPDIWFGSPPRCNVLFPENYGQLTYSRSFLSEPTRFMLKTNDEFFGEDFLFDKFYFAPQAGTLQADHARLQDMLRNGLLDHERFTGILPVFEKMGEFNIFASRASDQSNGQFPKISLAQRSANFLYFKHRFNSRKMQIGGKFNPYVAAGFPGLIIDKYVDASIIALHNELRAKVSDSNPNLQLSQQKISELLGTNFLGNFTQVGHMVSQEGRGSTTIACSYPRQVEESVEFMGAFDKVPAMRIKDGAEAVRSTRIAAVNPPKAYSLGPNNGRITQVQDVTEAFRAAGIAVAAVGSESEAAKLPLFDISLKHTPRKRPSLVRIGVPMSATSSGLDEIEEITGSRDETVVFKAYLVTEAIPSYRTTDVIPPAEELIRPGWYGDVWSPGKIGQVYNEFLSVGSITDPITIGRSDGSATGGTDPAVESALADQQEAEDAEDPRAQAPGVLSLEKGGSIQQAVEFLHLTYSYIRQQDADTEEFIRAYTWRPIATMIDMFGTTDLEYSSDGFQRLNGIDGFHSQAFGPYNDLFGLVRPEIEDLVGIKRNTQASQKADTRKDKLEKVQEYISALKFSRAILG